MRISAITTQTAVLTGIIADSLILIIVVQTSEKIIDIKTPRKPLLRGFRGFLYFVCYSNLRYLDKTVRKIIKTY